MKFSAAPGEACMDCVHMHDDNYLHSLQVDFGFLSGCIQVSDGECTLFSCYNPWTHYFGN